MKKVILTLIILVIASLTHAQTIGDHLNDIKKLKPKGTLDTNSKPYTYSIVEDDVNSLMMYFLNENLICDKIVIAPYSSYARQKWVISFNSSWIEINSTMWRFYKEDGMVLVCSMQYVENVGTIFYIIEEKIEN